MLPSMADITAIVLRLGEYFRDIGPFILFGAVAAAAQVTIFGRRSGPWTGERLIAPIAAIPLGLPHTIASALRSTLLYQTSDVGQTDPVASESGILRRAVSYVDGLILPFALSGVLAAAIAVFGPTDPLWSLFAESGPLRLLIGPLVAGVIKPRGGTELPLVLAMITKGLDPAGAVAAIAGAGYLHARSAPLALLHIAFGAGIGALFAFAGIA